MDLTAIFIIVILVAVLGVVFLFMQRRRRAAGDDVLPPPELSQPTDYTSLAVEEPQTISERFANASPVTKVLVILVPIIVIALLVALYQFLTPPPPVIVVPPSKIEEISAEVAGVDKIRVTARTDLPEGAQVTAAMKEDGADFAWVNEDTARTQVTNRSISVILAKSRNAPQPQEGKQYTIALSAQGANGQAATSTPAALTIPAPLRDAFYGRVVTTPTLPPTAVPTEAPTTTPVPPTAAPEATVVPTPTITPTAVFTGTVFNGGNIREQPTLNGRVLGQLRAGQTVTLQQRSADGQWYFLVAPEATGWASATLIRVDPAVASQVPTPTPQAGATGLTAPVFNGGRIRSSPAFAENQVGTINAGETVQLLNKTADGQWYKITDQRGTTGWVYFNLLRVPANVASQVPVGQ